MQALLNHIFKRIMRLSFRLPRDPGLKSLPIWSRNTTAPSVGFTIDVNHDCANFDDEVVVNFISSDGANSLRFAIGHWISSPAEGLQFNYPGMIPKVIESNGQKQLGEPRAHSIFPGTAKSEETIPQRDCHPRSGADGPYVRDHIKDISNDRNESYQVYQSVAIFPLTPDNFKRWV